MMEIVFYSAAFLFAYPYAFYPGLLALFSIGRSRDLRIGIDEPSITFVISAYNEEQVIAAKLENTLALEYPAAKREIIVVSDHSTDRTDEIVRNYASKGVAILTLPSRQGKTAGLNEAVKIATGEIVVFSDADSLYDNQALARIAETFSGDPRVGVVTGSTKYLAAGDGKMAETSSVYTKLEYFIKCAETVLGSCVGADGAIFAVRKELYQPLRADDINDLVIPLSIVRQQYRTVLRADLFCYETSSPDEENEFQRQVRITARTLRALFRNIDLMNPIRYPLFAFQLISHKLLRFFAPLLMIALFFINLGLLGSGVFYVCTWVVQAAAYLFVLWRYLLARAGGKSDRLNFLYHFVMINASMLGGWIRFLSGEKTVTWIPRGR